MLDISMSNIPMQFNQARLTFDAPTEFDVLCGSKSKAVSKHPGNVLLRQQVEHTNVQEKYKQATTKQERINLNSEVIQYMRVMHGSRFLKQNEDGTWSLAEEQSVRDKISHAIRHASTKKQPAPPSEDAVCDNDLGEDVSSEDRERILRVYQLQQQILLRDHNFSEASLDP